MFMAHEKGSGGYVSGKIKLAITLWILAGGDACDLAVIFGLYPKHCNIIMQNVLKNWIIATKIGGIDIYSYLSNKEAMSNVSNGFSHRSNEVLTGAIGALDGWLVRIVRPSLWRDGFKNVTAFFSRKGFYALNVQCIVDDKKRVLWLSYSHKGGSHDSSCFRNTKLYNHLKDISGYLRDNQFFILGDSAYCIDSFLIPPYDNAKSKTPEDDFNYYHSSARITVECAFGEIDLRWGIFWKRLNCSLETAAVIIEGAMRLHNYLVNYCESNSSRGENISDRQIFEADIENSEVMPVQTGSNLGRVRGNVPNDYRLSRLEGQSLRDELKEKLQNHDMHRLVKNNGWYRNHYSHIHRMEESN